MSKYRKSTNRKSDGKRFTKTASKSHFKNDCNNQVMRGGIRI